MRKKKVVFSLLVRPRAFTSGARAGAVTDVKLVAPPRFGSDRIRSAPVIRGQSALVSERARWYAASTRERVEMLPRASRVQRKWRKWTSASVVVSPDAYRGSSESRRRATGNPVDRRRLGSTGDDRPRSAPWSSRDDEPGDVLRWYLCSVYPGCALVIRAPASRERNPDGRCRTLANDDADANDLNVAARRDVTWRDVTATLRGATQRDAGDTRVRVSGRGVHEPRKGGRGMARATGIRWSCLLVTVRRLAPIRARPRWRHQRFDTCRRTTRQLDFTAARRRSVYYEQRILRTLHTLRLSGKIIVILLPARSFLGPLVHAASFCPDRFLWRRASFSVERFEISKLCRQVVFSIDYVVLRETDNTSGMCFVKENK